MYACRLHPEVGTTGAGQCPACGLDLIPAAETGGRGLTCPMHRAVRQQLPGTCPSCGMTLEPAADGE